MNARSLTVILVCLMTSFAGCVGEEARTAIDIIEYTYETETRIYDHNFTEVLGSEIMTRDWWHFNNSTSAVADLSFSYQKSPLSDGWVNISLVANDTMFFYSNTSDMGGDDFNNLTQEPLASNWTLTIHAKGSDYTFQQGGMFHDRYYLNMTVEYCNQSW